ncbi:hypothetical protein [Actinomadura sp. CNU-125]|uniref:hypothetical protein n=1 Tax=Actinomadura sp. CNU-125 TaxID=1904961 RepID=UPI001177C932|nr:hypothetical protein [Actinomadura sp. CNU-125]
MPISCSYCGGESGHDPNCYVLQEQRRGGPSSAGSAPGGSGGSGLFGVGCGCLVLAVAAVVAFVTFAFDVVVGQVMPNRGLSDRQVEAIEETTGVWDGTYVCDGERRAMRLTMSGKLGGSCGKFEVTKQETAA